MTKEEVRKLLQFLKSKKITAGQIAEKLVVSQGYISDMKNGRKPVTFDFIQGVATNFPTELQEYNSTKGEKGEVFHVKKQKGNPREDKYLKLLEDNDKFFKDLVKSNLAGLLIGQRSIQANIEAGFQYSLDREAGGDQVKAQAMQEELDRRIGEKMGIKPEKDNYAGI